MPFASARWYGNHAVSYNNTSPFTQNCDGDGDGTGGPDPDTGLHRAPANNNSSTSLVPEEVRYWVSQNGNLRCLFWDAALPSVDSLSYLNAWTDNTAQSVSFSISDAWGSWLNRYRLQVRSSTDNPNFSTWSSWVDALNVTNPWLLWTSYSRNYNFTAANNRAYQFRLQAWDAAGNVSGWIQPWYTIRIDTTDPVVGDINTPSPAPWNLLASDAYTTRIDVNQSGWAPISLVQWYFERHNSNNNFTRYSSNSDLNSANTSRLQIEWDISEVDNDGNTTDGERLYRFFISYIEDEAWNSLGTLNSSSTRIAEYDYDVSADTVNITTKSFISENVSSAWNFADGSQKNIQVRLRDQYGNNILPVWAPLNRTIDLHVRANNDLRLNQYENTWNDSAIFVGNNTNALPVGANQSAEITNVSSTNGTYTIPILCMLN